MEKINRLEDARTRLRAYNMAPAAANPSLDDAGVDQDDHDEAQGMAEACMNIAATHSDDEVDQLQDDLDDGLGNIHGDAVRSYASTAGKVLRPSQKNPRVRRWIKQAAAKHIGQGVLHAVSTTGQATESANNLSHVMHQVHRRQTGLESQKESALDISHYHTHHDEFVKASAKKYGVGEGVVGHALAFHAHAELAKQQRAEGPMKNGKPQPLNNKDITDRQFHKNLGGRAKSAFIKGMIARHGK